MHGGGGCMVGVGWVHGGGLLTGGGGVGDWWGWGG